MWNFVQQAGPTDEAAAGGGEGASSHDSECWEEECASKTENTKTESSCSIL
jgi:hypothetical protein